MFPLLVSGFPGGRATAALRAVAVVSLVLLLSPLTRAQSAINDDCDAAIFVEVPLLGSVNFFSVNTTEATESLPGPVCTSTSADDDVWFSFQPLSQGLRVRYRNANLPAGSEGVGYSIVEECCGSEIACNFRFGDGTQGDEVGRVIPPVRFGTHLPVTGLRTGAGRRVFRVRPPTGGGKRRLFGAITLPVQPAGECDFRRISTNVNTPSASPATVCSGGGSNNDDEFYRFTATAEYLTFTYENMVTTTGTTTGLGYSIHDGCSGDEVFCDFSFGDGMSGTQVVNPSAPFNLGRDYVIRLSGGEYLGGAVRFLYSGGGLRTPNRSPDG